MYSEKDIAEMKYQVSKLNSARSTLLGFAITCFILTPILLITSFFTSYYLLIVALVSLVIAITLLIIRSSVFSTKVDEYNRIIAKATKEREKNLAEQAEMEKVERIYRKVKQMKQEDDFSLDDLK